VAREVGVSQGHLTYYFPKKDDLWRAVAAHAFGELEGSLKDGLLERHSVRQMLAALTADLGRTQLYISLCLRAQYDDEVGELLRKDFNNTCDMMTKAYGPDGELLLVMVWGLGIRQLANGAKKLPPELVQMAHSAFDEDTSNS
jgi:AcrR family transcriptional regulator